MSNKQILERASSELESMRQQFVDIHNEVKRESLRKQKYRPSLI
jgi:hypothetical protein